MSVDSLSCPYCNSLVPPPAQAPITQRLTCPRCGESFPYRSAEAAQAAANGTASASLLATQVAAAPARSRWSNRAIATSVLGIMVLMAAVGLTYALLTVEWRRSRDPKHAETKPEPIRTVAPVHLAGLGYLPRGTNVVIAIHVAEALATPSGAAYLARSQFADTGLGMADIEKTVGLDRQDIEHVIFGLKTGEDLVPRMVLVVRTRRPIDEAKLRKTLKANRPIDIGTKHAVYHFDIEKPRWNALLWCPRANTAVIGLTKESMEAVPDPPTTAEEQLAAPVYSLIKERMSVGTQAWLVAHFEKQDGLPALAARQLPEEDREAVSQVRTAAMWLQLGESIRINGAVASASAPGAKSMEQALDRLRRANGGLLRVLGTGAEAEAVAKELAQSLKLETQETWVTFQATASAEAVSKAVGKR
ncbi:MAG: hypothetical protein K2R98_16940 [Gemmataceae bacterium]|nr:hypothetical protein [Gemmataceae bacterium]